MTSRRQVLRSGGTVVLASTLTGCLSDDDDGEFRFERVVVTDRDPDEYDSYRDVPEEGTHLSTTRCGCWSRSGTRRRTPTGRRR